MNEFNDIAEKSGPGSRLFITRECVFWTAAVFLLLIFLWNASFSRSEVCSAEITREMMLTGNWLYPMLNGKLLSGRLPLDCWCAVPFVKLFGMTEFAMRLPGALAALGALYLLRLLGKTLFTPRTAVISAWMFLGSAGFLLCGRSSSADMITAAMVLLAVLWYFKTEEGKTFRGYAVFYLLCFGSAFFKGESAFIIPFLLLLPRTLSEGRWKKHLNWKNFLAFFLCAGVCSFFFCIFYFLPFAPEQLRTPHIQSPVSEIFREGLTAELLKLSQLKETWYLSWRDLLLYLLPWTLILPAGIAGLLKNRKELPPGTVMLFPGICCAFVFCALFTPDSPGNIVVLLPYILLLSAAGFDSRGVRSWNDITLWAAFYFFTALSSLCICSMITYPLWNRIADHTPSAAAVLAPVAAGVIGWLVLFLDHRSESAISNFFGMPHRLCSVLLSGTVLSGCALSVLLPSFAEEFNMKKRFFTELHKRAAEKVADGTSEPVILFNTPVPPGYLFYNALTRPVTVAKDLGELIRQRPGTGTVLLLRNSKELLLSLDSQCRRYGIVLGKPFFVEESSRWSAPDTRNDHLVSYLVTLPGKKKETGQTTDTGIPGRVPGTPYNRILSRRLIPADTGCSKEIL